MASSIKVRSALSELPLDTRRRPTQVSTGKDKLRGSQAPVSMKSVKTSDVLTAKDCELEIQHHLNQRIASFFQQLIVCYKAKDLHFFIGDTIDQFGKGKTKGMKTPTCGAHFSTLPSLHVCDRQELENYQKDPSTHPKPKKFVYLKGSHYYTTQNSTDIIPQFINHADSSIDGKKTSSKLRRASIDLINQAALGAITPEKALISFVDSMQQTIERKLTKSLIAKSLPGSKIIAIDENNDPSPNSSVPVMPSKNRYEKLETLKIYSEETRKISEELKNNPVIFDQLLGLKINNDDALRQLLFPKRYEMIKLSQIIEAKIAHLINRGETSVSEIKKERVVKFLIKHSGSDAALLKLFCKPSSFAETKQKLSTLEKESLSEMANEIKKELSSLNGLELYYRSSLLKTLREDWKKWSQDKLTKVFTERYPTQPISRSMISRLENTRDKSEVGYLTPVSARFIDLDLEWAGKLAKTFRVDLGIWRMGFVTSS